MFLECGVHVFHGRREETFSDIRRTGRRSNIVPNRGRKEIKDRDKTPSRGVEVSLFNVLHLQFRSVLIPLLGDI